MTNTTSPQSIADVQSLVRSAERVFPRGSGSKPALSSPSATKMRDATLIEMTNLSGILEYQPGEYTFTALAGTPISTVEEQLSAEGQYLPFDPPMDRAGATLGGTVAAGLSGAGRYRYGGVRDFLIGIRFVDGLGDLVMGGGKVVKNAAGFDLPKLMVGSAGHMGILVEVSFKVFPAPITYRTLEIPYPTLGEALDALRTLVVAPVDIDAIEILPNAQGSGVRMLIRIGGLDSVLYARLGRLEDLLTEGTIMDLAQEPSFWHDLRNFTWAGSDADLVKIPISSDRIPALDALLSQHRVERIYSVGGNLCWVAWAGLLPKLDELLTEQSLSGLVLRHGQGADRSENGAGMASRGPHLGIRKGLAFAKRVQHGIDPQGKFLPI